VNLASNRSRQLLSAIRCAFKASMPATQAETINADLLAFIQA
jgi:hypothetical protein